MLLFLALLINSASADTTHTCSIRDINLDEPLLTRYAADSARLAAPMLFRTEPNPEFDPDNPTTFWALPTTGSTVVVKVHHATTALSAGSIGEVWVDTLLTIDPATKTVSGNEECNVLHPTTEHILEILNVTHEPTAN